VVVGHSYGGNRARLFADQLQRQLNRTVDLLVTIDPIDWMSCNIGTVAFGSGDPIGCNQTLLPTRVSTAREVWGFYQTLGYHVGGSTYYILNGYIPLNAVGFRNVPVSHTDIDDDGSVQSALTNMFLTASTGPRVAEALSGLSRSGSTISLTLQMTLQPMMNANGVVLTGATLNGVTATNLTSVSGLGDLRVGNSRTITLQFPISAGTAGSSAVLVVKAENNLGQAVTFPFLRLSLP
jgi:hypothetical protein